MGSTVVGRTVVGRTLVGRTVVDRKVVGRTVVTRTVVSCREVVYRARRARKFVCVRCRLRRNYTRDIRRNRILLLKTCHQTFGVYHQRSSRHPSSIIHHLLLPLRVATPRQDLRWLIGSPFWIVVQPCTI